MAVYAVAPYDILAARSWSWAWVLPRLGLNFGVALAYYGFFYVALYVTHLRPKRIDLFTFLFSLFGPLLVTAPPFDLLISLIWSISGPY